MAIMLEIAHGARGAFVSPEPARLGVRIGPRAPARSVGSGLAFADREGDDRDVTEHADEIGRLPLPRYPEMIALNR